MDEKVQSFFEELKLQWTESQSLEELCRENNIAFAVLAHGLTKITGLSPRKTRHMRPAGVNKIVAIHSGKGGVGKTLISCALAQHLSKSKRVGLLDLDLDCPNVFKTLGLDGKIKASEDQKILPLRHGNLKVLSMAGIKENQTEPTLWRGPIMTRAIQQLMNDTDWGELDILFLDLPPGTSDIPLTVMQTIKPDSVIVVTTPQEAALMDASKSIEMCRQLNVELAGVIENMTGEVFGQSRGMELAEKYETRFFGDIPLRKGVIHEFASICERIKDVL